MAVSVDTVARLGGDEFLLILDNLDDPAPAAALAQTLLDALAEPFMLDEHPPIYLSASIGISLYPDDACDATELVQHADLAMFRAKQARNATIFIPRR